MSYLVGEVITLHQAALDPHRILWKVVLELSFVVILRRFLAQKWGLQPGAVVSYHSIRRAIVIFLSVHNILPAS